MTWTIYLHKNKINGKCYIGQTNQDLKRRWKTHGEGYLTKNPDGSYSQPKFARAILKHGWDNFTHEILERDIPSQDFANELEIYYIDHFNSIKNGYNISKGGEGITLPSKPILQIKKGVINPVIKEWNGVNEASQKLNINGRAIYLALNSHKNSAGGFYWCYKHKYKQWTPPKNKARFYLDEFEYNVLLSLIKDYFNKGLSVKEIALKVNQSVKRVQYILYKLHLIRKERWTKEEVSYLINNYYELGAKKCANDLGKSFSGVRRKAQNLKLTSKYRIERPNQRKKVFCLETNTTYLSIADASKKLGVDNSAISRVCRGIWRYTHGYHFKYVD